MDNHHGVMAALAQISPPWIGVAVGHFADNITLSNIALLASIAYSIVNIWAHFRKKK